MTQLARPLIVYLPDTRGVEISRYGRGNMKLGASVFTYSRPAGQPTEDGWGTCPGSTAECEAVCYAKRIGGDVFDVYQRNVGNDVPPIPDEARLLRIHVSGDFDTPEYIRAWIARLRERPDVTAWAYTRSWRCHSLLEFLEELRALPNVQLFASMDASTPELPPAPCHTCGMERENEQHLAACPDDCGAHDYVRDPVRSWRRAWLWRNFDAAVAGQWPPEDRLVAWPGAHGDDMRVVLIDSTPSYTCPEETGRQPNCVACGYCFKGQQHDVTFLEHHPKTLPVVEHAL